MIRLRFSKKEIGNITVFAVAAVIFFIMYLPASRQAGAFKKELNLMRREIGSLDKDVLAKTDFSSAIESLRKENVSSRNLIPSSEEEIIERFYKAAGLYKVNILSMDTQAQVKGSLKEEKLSILEKELTRKKLKVVLEGGYLSLGRFLEELRKEFNDLVILDSLSISKSEQKEVLNINAEFFIWLS